MVDPSAKDPRAAPFSPAKSRNSPTVTVVSYPIDYRDLGGVLQPHKVTVEVAGQKRVMAVHCIEQNVELPKDKFALPGEMKAPLNKGQKPE